MSAKTKAIVLSGYGINCELETAYACSLAGFDVVDIVHFSELLHGEKKIDDYHFLNLPGGFLDGDDLGSAKACANRILHARVKGSGERLFDQFLRFIFDGKLILGVCNGFQLLIKLGLLPGLGGSYGIQSCTLTFNDSGRFEDRWVYLKVNPNSPCVFTRGSKGMYLPVRHGEGKFVTGDDSIRTKLHESNLVVLQYSDRMYRDFTMAYPENPNGSVDGIAGICDPTGRILGLMPHPEAYLHFTNHPRWTREQLPEEGMGLLIFKNAHDFVRKNLV
ncbi:MAG: phosphoribosylformylglycinamidine synthase subunit PurQ [Syntrophales bacterium]|nr:phosphoribosylformylglycinamidine synthase subunit PurQ [Syntrophales bacterium]